MLGDPGKWPVWRCLPLLVAFAVGATSPASADPLACPDSTFRAEAEDAALRQEICVLAPALRNAMRACGLQQRRPLTIEVVSSISHPMGTCLADFNCDYDLIRITAPDRYGNSLDPEMPYWHLPPDVTFRALLAHELAHALATQSSEPRELDMVDHEYIAGAMELELMDARWRDVYRSVVALDRPPSEGLIDIWIYGFAPKKFAVNAWQHFRLPENGCALISRLVAGEDSFSKAARPDLR